MQSLSMPAAITRDLPDSKTGAKTIHLDGPALEVLANAERIKGNPRREGRQIPEGPAETLVAGEEQPDQPVPSWLVGASDQKGETPPVPGSSQASNENRAPRDRPASEPG